MMEMRPDRVPEKVLDVFLELWADEGFEAYWKVTPRWDKK
jgi:hypothetical protein